ncbi:MAG: helix-turn-helix transcriptional regulator [Chloroflexi bacterium]|nr:helix-turn-helix transcriptional regulator [Chloroflexota bacterium]
MTDRQATEARRQATRIHRGLAEDFRRLRLDASVGRSQLAVAAGVDLGYICRIEDGRERPSIDMYAKLALAMGADLSCRLYPNTGPAIHDRHQARILEALLREVHPRWRPHPEVGVRQPARGWIDVVLHAPREGTCVCTEIESDLRRIEQQLRWFTDKVGSLPSWEGWAQLGDVGPPSRLLIVRSTKATRSIGREFARQLAAAYPAHPADALAALMGTAPWPGAALIWAEIEPARVRFIGRR